MCMYRKEKCYQITLPSFTDKAIIRWFEQMATGDELSEAIIALVHDQINTNPIEEEFDFSVPEPRTVNHKASFVGTPLTQEKVEDDFFTNLYNWQESNNMLYQEESKKTKRKMLSV